MLITMPSPSRVYGHAAASFLADSAGKTVTAHVPNEVNVVYRPSSFLARKASSQVRAGSVVKHGKTGQVFLRTWVTGPWVRACKKKS